MSTQQMQKLFVAALVVFSTSVASAGTGSSSAAIKQAIASGSVDSIVAELEQAEHLPSSGAIDAVMLLVDHPSAKVRDAAGWWLTRRGARDEVLATMNARFVGQDPVAARNAADVLAAMRDLSALPALGAYLAKPLDEDSGRAAARAIGLIGAPSGKAALMVGFASPLAGVRAGSVAAMRDLRALIGQTRVSDSTPFAALFTDADAGVRHEAALTAGFLKDTGAVPALIVQLSDTDNNVRRSAAWALGVIGDGSARTALTKTATDSDAFVRSIATAALNKLH